MPFITELISKVTNFRIKVGDKLNILKKEIGQLDSLTTNDKSSLVGAVNEVNRKAAVNDGKLSMTTSNGLTGSGDFTANQIGDTSIDFKIDSQTMTKINNGQTAYDRGDYSNLVPYTGANKNVNLGSNTITSTGGFIGNASTATTLATARTINGTSFNGSDNITTANWGTARNITIGNTTKSVNGSGNVSWSLEEIGASSVSHTHPISDIAGLQTELNKIGNLPSLTTTNKTSLVGAVNEVNNIQIGGRNFLLNSTFIYGVNNWSIDTGLIYGLSNNSFRLEFNGATSNLGIYQVVNVEPNSDYVLTFETKATYQDFVYIKIGFEDYDFKTIDIDTSPNKWSKKTIFLRSGSSTSSPLSIKGIDSVGVNSFFIRNIKLEKGNKATDWTPALEDQVSDWNETDSTKHSFIKNKPTIPTVNNGQLTLSTETGLSGSANFTANQAGESTFSVAVSSTHKLPTITEWNALSTQTLSNSTSNLVVSNTVQRAALTGDVTAAQNSNATTIANSAVTHDKYQNIATKRILGRGATGTGNVQELTLGANLTLSTAGVLSATDTNTTYTAGNGLTLSGTAFSVNYGTSAGTSAQGNDSRINNGQTAFGWGNHSGKYFPLDSDSTLVRNANLMKTDGVFVGYQWSNTPALGIGLMTVKRYSPDWIKQTFEVIGIDNKTYTRSFYNGSTWSPWLEEYHTGNLPSLSGYVPYTGASASVNTGDHTITGGALGVTNISDTTGLGLSLYGGANTGLPTYGIAFSGTTAFGTHGGVTGDWATYFTMIGETTRGWIFRHGTANIASISSTGIATFNNLAGTGNRMVIANSVGTLSTQTIPTNTTYSAGNWFTLSGTAFSLPVVTSGSGNVVSEVAQSTNGITVTKGNSVPLQAPTGGDINSIRVLDTRSTNPAPSTNLKNGTWFDFKTTSAIGLTLSGKGNYSAVMTMVPYDDDSGNNYTAFRLAHSNNGLYFQQALSTKTEGWDNWKSVVDGGVNNVVGGNNPFGSVNWRMQINASNYATLMDVFVHENSRFTIGSSSNAFESIQFKTTYGSVILDNGGLQVSTPVVAQSFYESSLRRFKTNIKSFTKSGLDIINELEIVTFDRNDSNIKNKIGIIADDSPSEILNDELDAVDLYKTIFIQAKAIQELSKRLKKLEKINNV